MRIKCLMLLSAAPLIAQRPESCEDMRAHFSKFEKDSLGHPLRKLEEFESKFGPVDSRRQAPAGTVASYQIGTCEAVLRFGGNNGGLYSIIFQDLRHSAPSRAFSITTAFAENAQKLADLNRQLEELEAEQLRIVTETKARPILSPSESMLFTSVPLEGDFFFLAGKYDQAVSAYTQAIPGSSSPDHIYLRLGLAYHSLGKFDDALKYFDASLQIRERFDVKTRRLLSAIAAGRYSDAVARKDVPESSATQIEQSPGLATQATGVSPPTSNGPSSTSSKSVPGTAVNVKGYTKKNGTYVPSHTRSSPRK
jgi:tetratricopeptide (TPR) repeat protein